MKKYMLGGTIPYFVVHGKQTGPVFMIAAGIHGNERASILAARRLVTLISNEQLDIQKGTLIIVPLVNKKAYEQRIRGVPDMNRTFPSSSNEQARHPISGFVFKLVKRYKPLWYLDLHEANGLSQINPRVLGQTLITNSNNPRLPAVKGILKQTNDSIKDKVHHFNIRLRELPGSSRTAAARLQNSIAVTVETCWSLQLPVRVNYQLKIVYSFLREAGLIKGKEQIYGSARY